jgi:hypothetical protein
VQEVAVEDVLECPHGFADAMKIVMTVIITHPGTSPRSSRRHSVCHHRLLLTATSLSPAKTPAC